MPNRTPIPRRSVGILVFPNVEVLDFAGPYEVFSRARLTAGLESRRDEDSAPFEVWTVAASDGLVAATGGLRVMPDFTFGRHPAIDILVVPGGWGTRPLLNDRATLEWIAANAAKAQLVTSVCSGALLLAKTGLLAGRRATTHWGALGALGELDRTIRVEQSTRVVDDGVMTSAGVSAGIDLALAVVQRFHGRAVADDTAHYMEYRRPPD